MVLFFQDPSGLAQGITQGAGALAQALGAGLKERAEAQRLKRILQPVMSPEEQRAQLTENEAFRDKFINMVQDVEATRMKDESIPEDQKQLTPNQLDFLWQSQLQQATKTQPETSQGVPQYSQQQILAIGQKYPQLASLLQQGQIAKEKMGIAREKLELEKRKQLLEEGVIPETKRRSYAGVADQVEKLMKQASWSKRITPFSEEGAEIKALGEQMFAAIRDKVVKGNMSKPVFDYIKNTITVKPTDTNAMIQGKLNAFRRYINSFKEGEDYSNLSVADVMKIGGKRNSDLIEKETTLNKNQAQKFLEAAKGDKEKARQMARDAGYTF